MSTAPYLGYVYSVHLLNRTRRTRRARCGKDLDFNKCPVTDDPAEVTCASCNRLSALDLS